MKLKKLLLLAGVGSLFFFSQNTFAQEINEALAKQQTTIATLENQLTEIQKEQIIAATKEEQQTASLKEIETRIEQLGLEKVTLIKKIESKETLIQAVKDNLAKSGTSDTEHSFATALSVLIKQHKQLETELATIEKKWQQQITDQTTLLEEKASQAQEQTALIEENAHVLATLETEKNKLTELEQQKQKEEEQAAALARTGFLSPLTIPLNVSSPFGYRVDPTGYSGNQHDGIDLTGSYGTPILAARYGTVVEAGYQASAGNYAIIQHDNGYYTYYMHMTELFVSVGQSLETSQQIGTMGTTGNSTGVHLHFGIATGIWNGFVDPASFIL